MQETRPHLIYLGKSSDNRGDFIKIFSKSTLETLNSSFHINEVFSSFNSEIGTIRGMHIQKAPSQSRKIIWVESGAIHDVCINLNEEKNYGEIMIFSLTGRDGKGLFIPPGWAHGYQTIKSETLVSYLTDQDYDADLDDGVRYDSLGLIWPLEVSKISKRDKQFRRI